MKWLLLPLAIFGAPALAWDFGPTPVCTLSHETAQVALAVTYDPTLPEPFAISLTLSQGTWPDVPVFALRFDGPDGLVISTDRHSLSDDGRTLRVTDRGFGNVLDGIGRSRLVTALAGPLAVTVPLDGAGPPLAAFRDCPQDVTS